MIVKIEILTALNRTLGHSNRKGLDVLCLISLELWQEWNYNTFIFEQISFLRNWKSVRKLTTQSTMANTKPLYIGVGSIGWQATTGTIVA